MIPKKWENDSKFQFIFLMSNTTFSWTLKISQKNNIKGRDPKKIKEKTQ